MRETCSRTMQTVRRSVTEEDFGGQNTLRSVLFWSRIDYFSPHRSNEPLRDHTGVHHSVASRHITSSPTSRTTGIGWTKDTYHNRYRDKVANVEISTKRMHTCFHVSLIDLMGCVVNRSLCNYSTSLHSNSRERLTTNLSSKLDFPTPESPTKRILNR